MILINGEEYSVDNILENTNFKENFHEQVNPNLQLTQYQINVLKRLHIDYENIPSLKELIYIMNEVFDETLDEELELILDEISERDYYENSQK